MNTTHVAILVVAALSTLTPMQPKKPAKLPAGYAWEPVFELAKLHAAIEDKLLYVDFHMESYPACKAMDAQVYPRDDVKAFLAAAICIRINPEESKADEKVAEQFKVKEYPSVMLFAPNGDVLQSASGVYKPEEFVRVFTTQPWNDFVAADHAKPTDWRKMAKSLLTLSTWFAATEEGKRAAATMKDRSEWKELASALAEARAEKDRQRLAVRAPAQLKLGKKKEAIESWQAILKSYPESPEAADATKELKKLGVKIASTDGPPKKE